jgi:hypothetical protein
MNYDMMLQGDWMKRSDEEQRADEAAVNYDANCEVYDRMICGSDGIPKTSEQMSKINRHAIETKNRLIAEYRITPDQFQDAIMRLRRPGS